MSYYRKCWRMSCYKSGNDYGSSKTGPQYTLPLMSEDIWTMFSPIVGLGGVVQYSGHHVLPISLLWISFLGRDEVFGVRDTYRHSRRAGCPCCRSCSNYSWDTIICTQIPAVQWRLLRGGLGAAPPREKSYYKYGIYLLSPWREKTVPLAPSQRPGYALKFLILDK